MPVAGEFLIILFFPHPEKGMIPVGRLQAGLDPESFTHRALREARPRSGMLYYDD